MNDHTDTSSGDAAVVFLRQVAELIGIDNLPAPIGVTPYSRNVQVEADDVPVWCKALGLPLPTWERDKTDPRYLHARWDADTKSVTGLVLASCRIVESAVA